MYKSITWWETLFFCTNEKKILNTKNQINKQFELRCFVPIECSIQSYLFFITLLIDVCCVVFLFYFISCLIYKKKINNNFIFFWFLFQVSAFTWIAQLGSLMWPRGRLRPDVPSKGPFKNDWFWLLAVYWIVKIDLCKF